MNIVRQRWSRAWRPEAATGDMSAEAVETEEDNEKLKAEFNSARKQLILN